MRNKLFVALLVSAIVLGGCSTASVETDSSNEASSEASTDEAIAVSSGIVGDTDSETGDYLSMEEYEAQIESEVSETVSSASSLTEEIYAISGLCDEYEMMLKNAETQADMNFISQCAILVWQKETESLLGRIKEKNSDKYVDISNEYSDWEKHAIDISTAMAYEYNGGSIQAMIINGNLAYCYRNEALALAEQLADIIGDKNYDRPYFGPCGFYGQYEDSDYLIVTEGMEGDSYRVLIHREGKNDITGNATATDDPTTYNFTSDNGAISGELVLWLGASLKVKETNTADVNTGEELSFEGLY